MTDLTALKELLERVEKAEGPDRELDEETIAAIGGKQKRGDWWIGHSYIGRVAPPYTSSIDACVALIEKVLPDWWHTAGLCSLTGHASIGPDYNGPAGERLRREFPVERFDGKFDADLAPGDGKHRTCYALLHCILQALIAKEESNA